MALLSTSSTFDSPMSAASRSSVSMACWPSWSSISRTTPASSLSRGNACSFRGSMYLLGCTGGRSGEFVDNEKQPLKDGSLEEIFGPKAQKTMTSRTRTRSPDYSRTCCLRQVENAGASTLLRGSSASGCPSSRDWQRRLSDGHQAGPPQRRRP